MSCWVRILDEAQRDFSKVWRTGVRYINLGITQLNPYVSRGTLFHVKFFAYNLWKLLRSRYLCQALPTESEGHPGRIIYLGPKKQKEKEKENLRREKETKRKRGGRTKKEEKKGKSGNATTGTGRQAWPELPYVPPKMKNRNHSREHHEKNSRTNTAT